MESFLNLLKNLDQTTSIITKVESLRDYFYNAEPEDASWALYIISGEKIPTKVNRSFLQQTFCEFIGIQEWLFKESYYHVGDLSETMALLRGPKEFVGQLPTLHSFIEQELLSLKEMNDDQRKSSLFRWWSTYDEATLFFIHKCFTGGLRLGVSKNLLIQALSQVAGVDKETMSFRLMGKIEPGPDAYKDLMNREVGVEKKSKPYPFFLASPIDTPEGVFHDLNSWCVEWKWDGIRCQLVKRDGEVFLWSRGEELVNDSFPEVLLQATFLPDGTVIDGELLPYKNGKILSFQNLQTRLNRKRVSKKELESTPVTIMTYDLLEWDGIDVRNRPLSERRALLEKVGVFPISEILEFDSLESAKELRLESRERGVEGFMLKRWNSTYQVGRKRGDWWKWKIDPLTIDCVLLYAQSGSGRRSNLYTDYTLAVWKDQDLVPITKAYSGLTDEELLQMDHWIKRNTIEKYGPVRSVKAEQVFEISFDGIQESPRHKAGIALRFPRITRWRKDKKPLQADSLDEVRKLL